MNLMCACLLSVCERVGRIAGQSAVATYCLCRAFCCRQASAGAAVVATTAAADVADEENPLFLPPESLCECVLCMSVCALCVCVGSEVRDGE